MRSLFLLLIIPSLLLIPSGSVTTFSLGSRQDMGQFSHETWQVEAGLPQNTVKSILQTHDGCLWFATEAGLASFDGISFTVYDRASSKQIKNNDINCLCEDRRGALRGG